MAKKARTDGKAICSRCQELLNLDRFYRSRSEENGRHPYCKVCFEIVKVEYEREKREEYRRMKAYLHGKKYEPPEKDQSVWE